jgi:hypothetical protein
MHIKQISLDQAIKSNAGSSYDDEGRHITNSDKIVEAAKKFEAYLKETGND